MGTRQGSLEQNYLFVPPSAEVHASGFVILKTNPPDFCISELGNQVQIFRHFLYGFQYGIKSFALGQLLTVVPWGKNSQLFIQIKTGDHS